MNNVMNKNVFVITMLYVMQKQGQSDAEKLFD